MISETSRYRYERKFQTNLDMPEALQVVRENPGHFAKVFDPRQINNIYFDTPGFDFYYDNIEGERNRIKVRIRWYGPDRVNARNPVLELKKKAGFFGEKITFPLKSFSLDKPLDTQKIFAEAPMPVPVRDFVLKTFPVLMNSYLRHYFLSRDGRYRLTVDDELSFFPVHHKVVRFHSGNPDHTHRILELKYDVSDDHKASEISAAFPFRLSKSSKYLSGVERVCL